MTSFEGDDLTFVYDPEGVDRIREMMAEGARGYLIERVNPELLGHDPETGEPIYAPPAPGDVVNVYPVKVGPPPVPKVSWWRRLLVRFRKPTPEPDFQITTRFTVGE